MTRPLTALLAFYGCVSASLAHEANFTRVGIATQLALRQLQSQVCHQEQGSTVCNVDTGSAAQLSQFAPDKLVVHSMTGLSAVSQRISLVSGRLDDLRQSQFTGSPFSATGVKSLAVVPAVAPTAQTPTPYSAPIVAPPSPAPAAAAGATPATAGTSAQQQQQQQQQQLGGGAAVSPPTPPSSEAEAASPAAAGASAQEPATSAAFASTDFGMYVRAEGDRGENDPTSFDPGFKSRSTGLTVGADYKVSTNAVLGGALSYSNNRSTIDTSLGASSGSLKNRGASLSMYGAYYPAATAYLDATLVYGRNRYESVRNISIPAVLIDSAIGSTKGKQYGLSLGGGYSFLSSNVSFGPYARLSWSKSEVDAFTEQENVSGTNLAVQAQSAKSLVSVLGGQISYAVSKSWGVLVPNARLEWEHQHKDDRARNILAGFSENPSGALINIETTPADRNYFNLGVGLASHFGVGRSAFIYYQTVLGKTDATNHAVTAELRLEF